MDDGDWFADGVRFVYQSGLMNGTDGGANTGGVMLFSPHLPVTRGMVVTVLYRMAGGPDVSEFENPFDDVEDGQWYTDAVVWAAANSLANGYGGGRFGPGDSVTRGQLAVLLYNYQQFSGGIPADVTDEIEFDDADSISAWAAEAVAALVRQGLLTGRPGNVFDPKAGATRAEFAVVLLRYFTALA